MTSDIEPATTERRVPDETGAVLSQLLRAIPQLYFRLADFSNRSLAPLGLTAGKRAILRDLAEAGPLTITYMATARPVARQYIQKLVAELADAGLVALGANPVDGRSKLVSLTDAGRTLVDRLDAEEAAIVAVLAEGLDWRQLEAAHDIVLLLRDRLAIDADPGRDAANG